MVALKVAALATMIAACTATNPAAAAASRVASYEQSAELSISSAFASYVSKDRRSALSMATSIEARLAKQMGVPVSRLTVTDIAEASTRRMQVSANKATGEGGTQNMGTIPTGATRLTIRYSITCVQGQHSEAQKSCADEAKNMTDTTTVAAAILAGIEEAATKSLFKREHGNKAVAMSDKGTISTTITQPHLVYIQVAPLTCEDRADAFVKACTSRANGCPAGCEVSYRDFYDKCFYEEYKLFQKKRVHVWTEKDAGHAIMKNTNQLSDLTNQTSFDVMDYVAATALKNRLETCNFKDTSGTCRFAYLTAILGTQWMGGTGYNCSTKCNPVCRNQVSTFKRACQKNKHTFQTDEGVEVSWEGMTSTLSLESACIDFTCSKDNIAHRFCDMIQHKTHGNTMCAKDASISTLMGLVRLHEGDLPGVPKAAKDCLTKVTSGMPKMSVKDFCNNTKYSCAPPQCTDNNAAMLSASKNFGGGPYNCSALKKSNFCPAAGTMCCQTCGIRNTAK